MRGERELGALCDQATANLNLPRNIVKCHWLSLSTRRLLWLLVVEVGELAVAVWRLRRAKRAFRRAVKQEAHSLYLDRVKRDILKARAAVSHEAGDVTAFAMMVADRCGALKY